MIDGGFQVLSVGDNSIAYLRDSEREAIVVVANRQPLPDGALPIAHGAIADGTEFTEVFSGARATVTNGHLPLPALPVGATIWRAKY